MDIGSKIKEYRKRNGLTQVQLANKSNISRSYLADVEKNRYNASVETLQKISFALGIELTDLLSYKEQLDIAKSVFSEANELIEGYYASKTDKDSIKHLEIDAETNLLINKIKRLSEKDRNTIEVLVDQLLREE